MALGLIGHPVGHSRSAVMMQHALGALGIDGTYTVFDVSPGSLSNAVKSLETLGFVGVNVTLPHKVGVIAHVVSLEETAHFAGAVNTLVRIPEGFTGANTDVSGLTVALGDNGVAIAGAKAVVLGAGGAARAAVAAMVLGGARSVTVIARSAERARRIVERDWRGVKVGVVSAGSDGARRALGEMTLVLQCTPCGMSHGADAEGSVALGRPEWCRKGAVAFEMVYTPRETVWMRAMQSAGLSVVAEGGLAMLAAQGAVSLSRWTGLSVSPSLMRRSLAVDVDRGRA